MPQAPMPAEVEVFYKLRTQRMQEVRLGTRLSRPEDDSDDVLSGVQNEGEFSVDFDPADDKYDLFYRSINENRTGHPIAIKRVLVSSNLAGALNDSSTSFTIDPPANTESFSVGDVIEIEDEFMVLLTWDTGSGAATVEERGAHGTEAVAHADDSVVNRMRYTVPHNSITLTAAVDSGLPLAPTFLVVANVVGSIGNGMTVNIGLPTSQIKSLFRVHIQTSTTLWAENFLDTTGLIGIQAAGSDGAIQQGGTSLVTSTTLDTAWAGKLIHTYETIDVATGEVGSPDILRISTVVDNGNGTWTVNISGDNVYNLRFGKRGVDGIVNWTIVDDWQRPGIPSSVIEQVKPFFNQGAAQGDPDVLDVTHTIWTAETSYVRARLRSYEGYGPWMYHNGVTGTITRASATTFTPGHIQGPAIASRAISAIKQSKGTIPATVNINMQSVDNDTVSWSAGNAAWADGTTESITSSGSPRTFTVDTVNYVYKIIGNSTLQFTTTFSTAVGNDRVYLGQVITTNNTDENATVFLFGDIQGPIFTAAVGAFGKLSALTADLGDINAGTIDAVAITGGTIVGTIITGGTFRTKSSGERIEMIDTANDQLIWYGADNINNAVIRYTEGSEVFSLFSQGIIRFTAGGVDQYVFSTTSFQIASGNILDMSNGDIGSCGNIELDSLTKDGGGAIAINDDFDMNGNDVLECLNITPASNNTGSVGTAALTYNTGFILNLIVSSLTADNGTNMVVDDHLDPNTDNVFRLGFDGKRYSDIWATLTNFGDIGLANAWKMREWPCTAEDVQTKSVDWMRENANLGIQFVDDDENLIAVLHKNGYLYCKGIRPLEELPV